MRTFTSDPVETNGSTQASGMPCQSRRRVVGRIVVSTSPVENQSKTENSDNHHETQTTCTIGATRSRRHHPFSLGDLGHNDCFYRRNTTRRRMGDRQEISLRHDLADLLSHNFATHLLFWDFAGADSVLGQSGRTPTPSFRLLACGLGHDSRHGLDHVLHPVGGNFVVSNAYAPAVSSVRRRIKVGCYIHVSAGGAVNRLLPTHATTNALMAVRSKKTPYTPASGATPN